MTDFAIGVVGHVDRRDSIDRIAAIAKPVEVSIDNGKLGCPGNHARTLAATVSAGQWAVVLEDDAILEPDFRDQLEAALAVAPARIVSLYLGTGYPMHWQARITKALEPDTSWVLCERLLHAVGYAIHPDIAAALAGWMSTNPRGPGMAPDDAISMWAAAHQELVAYTNPSIIDHADEATVILVRKMQGTMVPNRKMPRKAHNFGRRLTWDDTAVRMVR